MRWGTVLVLLVAFLVETGCGRKSPPLPPEIRVADTTRDLQVVQDEGMARLTWSFPQMTSAGGLLPDLESIEVWRAELPLSQEPPAGTTAKDRQTMWNLLEGRGEVIARLEGDGLDEATRGPNLEVKDDLHQWLSAGIDEGPAVNVVWYAVRSICCRGRRSDFSNIARLVPRIPAPAPDGLEVAAERDGIHLKWMADEKTKVQIERSDDEKRWNVVSSPSLAESMWVDGTAEQGQTWFYRLRSVTAGADGSLIRQGTPGESVRIDFPDLYPPEPPVDLVCLPEGGRVRLRWGAADGATGYSIERIAGQEAEVILVEAIVEVSFLDETPPSGNVTYNVKSVDAAGNTSKTTLCKTIVEAQ